MTRERAARAATAAFAVVAAAHLAAQLAGSATAGHLTKPVLVPLLAACAVLRGGPRLLVAALLCGWAGDVLLQLDGDTSFLLGMGAFAAGHVCYLTLFTAGGPSPTGGARPARRPATRSCGSPRSWWCGRVCPPGCACRSPRTACC